MDRWLLVFKLGSRYDQPEEAAGAIDELGEAARDHGLEWSKEAIYQPIRGAYDLVATVSGSRSSIDAFLALRGRDEIDFEAWALEKEGTLAEAFGKWRVG